MSSGQCLFCVLCCRHFFLRRQVERSHKNMKRRKSGSSLNFPNLSNGNRGYRRRGGNCQAVNVLARQYVGEFLLRRLVYKSRQTMERKKSGSGLKIRHLSNGIIGDFAGKAVVTACQVVNVASAWESCWRLSSEASCENFA